MRSLGWRSASLRWRSGRPSASRPGVRPRSGRTPGPRRRPCAAWGSRRRTRSAGSRGRGFPGPRTSCQWVRWREGRRGRPPPRPEHLEFILSEGPGTVYLDGPPTYLMGQGFGPDDLRASLRNIGEVLGSARVHTLIIDHHLLRDAEWRNEIREVVQRAMAEGKKIVTAAEYLGVKEELLEANRKRLFEQYPHLPAEPLQRNTNFQLSKELRQ